MKTLKTKIGDYIINTLPNDWMGVSINNGQPWEPHITKFLSRNLTKDSTFVDVGSNYGIHSINSSIHCNEVYSFEPQTFIFDIQTMNIKENNILNIKSFNCGIGNKNEDGEMLPIDYENNSLNMGDLSIGQGGEKIEIRTLDSFNIPRVDFIKIDVQGYEKYVLEGSQQIINRDKPTIIIEMENHQLNKFGYGVSDLFEQIKNLGYYIFFLEYFYPSDHVCVHKDNLESFILKNKEYISDLEKSNDLNHNKENGVKEQITYEKN